MHKILEHGFIEIPMLKIKIMKRTVVFLTFFVISFSIKAQLPSSCNVPDILKSNYEFDVAHLTFKWLHEIYSPDTSLIEIPQLAQEPIWEGLAAIYNRHDIIEIDSLFNKYCVHNSVTHSMISQSLWAYVDTSYAWTNNWALLQTTTGISNLDSLLANYGFIINSYYFSSFDNLAMVELITTQSINELPLCDSLITFPGIIDAHPSHYLGDGSTIEFAYSGDIRFYTFTLAWGDCWSGCTSIHLWKFKVNPDCSINFLGIENYIGDHFYAEPTNCNISNDIPWRSNTQPNVTVFPNPTGKYQTIRTNLPGRLSFVLVDGFGRKLLSGIFQKETTLDVRMLSQGLYFLKIQEDNNAFITKKIIIE
jgi:hypothetical protein